MELLSLQRRRIGILPFGLLENVQAALVLGLQSVRMGQQRDDLLPHELVEPLGPHLLIVAEACAAEAVGVGSNATIIGIVLAALARRFTDLFAVIGVMTLAADGQAPP